MNHFDEQLSLLDIQPVPVAGKTIAERFKQFHKLNPHVYERIKNHAFFLKEAGVQKFGMKAIFEKLRWDYAVQTQGEPFKLSNDFTAHYARLVMFNEPELKGFFVTKQLKS